MNGISKTYCGHYLPDSKVSGNIGAKILGILGKEMAEFPNTFESCEYCILNIGIMVKALLCDACDATATSTPVAPWP